MLEVKQHVPTLKDSSEQFVQQLRLWLQLLHNHSQTVTEAAKEKLGCLGAADGD